LIGNDVHSPLMADVEMLIRRGSLPKEAFHEEDRIPVETGGVGDELCISGVEEFDLINLFQEDGFPVLDDLGETNYGNSLSVSHSAIHFPDEPFGITNKDSGSWC